MIRTTTPAGPPGYAVLPDQSLRHALMPDAVLLTGRGAIAAGDLRPDDRVITREHGMARLSALHQSEMRAGAPMVLVPAHALGRARPGRDLLLLPDQPVALRGWRARTLFNAREARVAALRLADGRIVREIPAPGGPLVSIVLDIPSALYVEGLELVCASTTAVTAGR